MERKPKILIVEDDRDLVEMYETKFKMEGFDVLKVDNGVPATPMAKSEKPDLILLDIVMPEMDGFEVLKKLKASDSTKGIPVILLTNLGQEADVKKGMDMGAVDYLIKANFTPNEVVEKARKTMGRGEAVAV
ncbi:MAG: hypothetical protein ACD_63C00228G0004 [uncultured bacterium]|nr:MAG: hypothetical protein ACD_63C00228G0004 [uncultured bacterium]